MYARSRRTGKPVTGTLETIAARSILEADAFSKTPEGVLSHEHEGDTDVLWEESHGVEQARETVYIDADGHEILASEVELTWVRLFFVEEFLPYSWAFLPAGASLQCSFRGDSNQASAYPRLSGGQPSLETVPNTVGLSPPQARSLLDIRAAFWYGAVGMEAGLRWL